MPPPDMRTPQQVRTLLAARFRRDYPSWAQRRGSWPLHISLQEPGTAQRRADPVACHAWADSWRDYPGPGTVTWANRDFRTGVHPMPKTLVLARAYDVAAADPGTATVWQRCGARLAELTRHFPDARLGPLVRRITELADADHRRLVTTASWLRANPSSGMLLRQLPIEGIDTKWLQRHAPLVLALLGDDPDASTAADPDTGPASGPGPDAGPNPGPGSDAGTGDAGATADDTGAGATARLRLYRRLGLRVPPELIQVAVLDPELRHQIGGMRHLAASTDDLNRWEQTPDTVVILEAKETGYAVTTDHPGAVILHGQGFSVAAYARIGWVRTARRVIYWGDLDLPGLHFVDDLRGHGIDARTILTDRATLDRYRHLAVDGAGTTRSSLPHLTPDEMALYRHLAEHAAATGTGLLLEQERILWPDAYRALVEAMASPSEPAAARP
ncbi:Wadjet anti-phage system protein JetD domain-containing protein [Actinocatenispora sera]|nr:Wadjet anti-phage system protein JetD domain-containing protein [Actinocatenispora sera]